MRYQRSPSPGRTSPPMTVDQDLQQSAGTFESEVYPEFSDEWFDGAQYVSIEGMNGNSLADALDMAAGADGAVVHDEFGLRFLAARVHRNTYDTMTIRHTRASGAKTEFEKRQTAIENKNVWPYYTLQAYCPNDPKIRDAMLMRTDHLIEYIEEGSEGDDYMDKTTYGNGTASFYSIPFDDLDDCRYPTLRMGDNPIDSWEFFDVSCPDGQKGCPGPESDEPTRCLGCVKRGDE